MAMNLDYGICCWNGFVSYLFEAVHCHSSSADNIGRKCSSCPLIRWLYGYEFGQGIVVGMELFLMHSRLSIAIRLLLIY